MSIEEEKGGSLRATSYRPAGVLSLATSPLHKEHYSTMRTTFNLQTWLDGRTGLFHRIAEQYHLDYEEVRQEAAAKALSILRKKDQYTGDLTGYVGQSVINHFRTLYTRSVSPVETLSLDEPVYEDECTTYADVLPAPPLPSEEDYAATDRRAYILYDALRRLPLDEQVYLQSVYELNAYNILNSYEPNFNRTNSAVSKAAFRHLRKDKQLRAQLQEVYA